MATTPLFITYLPGGRTLSYRYRWLEDVPLRDGKDALHVNWLGVTITDTAGKTTYTSAFVTSLTITSDQTTWPKWRPALEPAGRSKMKASTC